MNPDQLWEQWITRFAGAERDVRTLFHNRHIWVSMTQMWQDNAEAIQLNDIVQNWFIRLYVTTQ